MPEDHYNEQQISTKPLRVPKVFHLSPELSEELTKVVGNIEWLVFLKPDDDFVNVGVLNETTLIRINGCNGEIDVIRPPQSECNSTSSLNENWPERENKENQELIHELLIPRPHAKQIAISYTADNTCLNINGHMFYF